MRLRHIFLLLALLAFPIAAQTQKIPADSARVERKTEDTVYITRRGTKYHRAGCRFLSKSAIPLPLSVAKKYYQPCKRCIMCCISLCR